MLICFAEIIHILDMNPTKGNVALIRATDGTVLHMVADDPKWQKIHQDGEHQRQEVANAQPKKHGPFCKWPHMETTNRSNNQDGVELAPDLPMVPVRNLYSHHENYSFTPTHTL